MAGAAVMLFVTSWKLALLVLVGAPATLLPILLLGRRVRRLSRAKPGPRRRRLGLRRRGAARDPHGAGLRPRGRGPRELRAPRRGGLPHRRRAHRAQGVPDRRGDPDRLQRGRHHPVDRRPRRDGRAPEPGRARGVRVLRRGGRGRRRHGGRGLGRAAARRRRERAPGRAARHRAAHRRAARLPVAAAAALAAGHRVRPHHLRLSVAPAERGAGALHAAASRPASASRWSGPRAPASPPRSRCCCASTTRSRARCASAASTCGTWTRAPRAAWSRWCRRSR